MDATTIKLHKRTKSALDKFRKNHESYNRIISKLITTVKQKHLKKELMEAYKSKGKNDLELLEEWEIASNEIA